MSKTFKRETAGAMLVFLFGLFTYGVYHENLVAIDAAKYLTLPVFTFTGLAFGFDAYAKQAAK